MGAIRPRERIALTLKPGYLPEFCVEAIVQPQFFPQLQGEHLQSLPQEQAFAAQSQAGAQEQGAFFSFVMCNLL